MRPIHILYLIDVLYTRHGGGEGALWKMTHMLPPDRYRCSVATFASRPEEVVTSAFDCPVHLLPIRRTYDRQALRMALRLRRLIRDQQVSILHTFFNTSDLFGGTIAKLSGCPILISSRRDMGIQRSAAHRIAYRLAGGMFDQVHAVSERVRAWHIRQDRLPPEKVRTVYNGVDLEEMDRARNDAALAEVGLLPGPPVIVCVANIRPVKAMEVLVKTAAIVCREYRDTRFLVVGKIQDLPYMEGIWRLAAGLNMTRNVIFAGQSCQVPALLRCCDIFFLPSHSEGLSNALLEAMACGLPCVATDVGGNAELIENGRTGFLVSPGNDGAAGERILQLLRDPGMRRSMGLAGRGIVEGRFSAQAMVDRVAELYEELLEHARSTVSSQCQAVY